MEPFFLHRYILYFGTDYILAHFPASFNNFLVTGTMLFT